MPNQLESSFQNLLAQKASSPAWLLSARQVAFSKFQELGFPTRQNEDWKYTSTRNLAEASYRLPEPSSLQLSLSEVSPFENRLVFLDGHYLANLSQTNPSITITPVEALSKDELVKLEASITSQDALKNLNQAFSTSGYLIRVKKGTRIETPVHLVYRQSPAAAATMISPRNIIVVESNSEVSFLESHVGESEHFTNVVADIHVQDNAHCHYVLERILRAENSLVASHTFHLSRDAQLKTFNLALGGRLNRAHLTFRLLDPGAFAKLDGLYQANDGNHIDNVTEVQHLAANTSSAQLYKGILEGKSRAVFNGKITIVKDAQKVDAQQLNKNLLMSREAEVDSRPQLVIDANDVKCSHGATIGQLDEQELFYLQSRAISKDDARKMLAKAFVGDVIGQVEDKILSKHLENSLETFGSRTGL